MIDLAATDVLRVRERGVPRYNDFRELFHKPRVSSFEELTGNPETAAEVEAVYGDIDRVDLMIGLYSEPLPKGFGFSDTAFRVFVLMASRRLKSDRFFTQRLPPRRLLAHRLSVGAGHDDERRAPAPLPRARARAARGRECVRALETHGVSEAAVRQLAAGLWCIGQRKGGRVHAFLCEDGGELTLVDTLYDPTERGSSSRSGGSAGSRRRYAASC